MDKELVFRKLQSAQRSISKARMELRKGQDVGAVVPLINQLEEASELIWKVQVVVDKDLS